MVLSMDKWRGKVAIVTGASSGCGAAIAIRLVEEGLKVYKVNKIKYVTLTLFCIQVVALARRKEKLDELCKQLQGKPGKLYPFKADMTVEADIIEAFNWTTNNVGRVHVLINSAGISKPTTLSDGDTEMWKKVLDTNVLGLSIATREAIKIMKENKIDGHIIHINSVLGHYVAHVPNLNMYSASKFAVTALVETLRQEFLRANMKIRITVSNN